MALQRQTGAMRGKELVVCMGQAFCIFSIDDSTRFVKDKAALICCRIGKAAMQLAHNYGL